jgi:hypothetical protein
LALWFRWITYLQHSILERLLVSVITHMDYIELQEMRRVLRAHEEVILGNRTSIFTVTSKVHDNEQQIVSQIASIMSTLVQLK